MALIVETGLIVAGADSYISLADADLFQAALGRTTWATASEASRELALRKAARYLENEYRGKWKGAKVTASQSLSWPRMGAYDEDDFAIEYTQIPQVLKDAQCHAAYRILTGTDLMPDLARGGQVASEKIDVITITYADGAPANTRYQEIETALSGLISAPVGGGLGLLSIERA